MKWVFIFKNCENQVYTGAEGLRAKVENSDNEPGEPATI